MAVNETMRKLPFKQNNEFSFGINPDENLELLTKIFLSLTNYFDFIYTTNKKKVDESEFFWASPAEFEKIIRCAASFLITTDFSQEPNGIYFGCETTTVAWVLTIINKNFSEGKKLNPYRIHKSMKFYVCSNKRPTKNASNFKKADFRVLTRSNYAKSLDRFINIYSQDPQKIESKHYQDAIKIFRRHNLVF